MGTLYNAGYKFGYWLGEKMIAPAVIFCAKKAGFDPDKIKDSMNA